MDIGSQILSDMVHHGKYSKFLPDLQRRETYKETVDRNCEMHVDRFPQHRAMIRDAYALVHERKVLPSMRSMQFAGKAILKNNARIYNCAFMPIDHHAAFAEGMFLLLCGTGVGYSVQAHNVNKLPTIKKSSDTSKYLIGDSIEGWADAVRHLVKAYLQGTPRPRFVYDDIRDEGERLSSGGRAPGPDPLRKALDAMERILFNKPEGSYLTPLECHDMMCIMSEAVLSGGIRRSAMIAMFDDSDMAMMTCKNPDNFQYPTVGNDGVNAFRARSNNSPMLLRHIPRERFDVVWSTTASSGSGEPAVYWTNNLQMGSNPCVEIALLPHGFCNLTEVNASNIENQDDFNQRAWACSVIGTLQATFTDFHYLRPIWGKVAKSEALLGVGMTGIASGAIFDLDITKAAKVVKETNQVMSAALGIEQAKRTTCVKPSGTTSIVLGCSSGVHAWHDKFYIRRMRLNKSEPLAIHLMRHHKELLEDSLEKPDSEVIVAVPVAAPEGAITRHNETAMTLLERVKRLHIEWVTPGHVSGDNQHNVSCTANVKNDEWNEVGDWMWENREHYAGIACFPFYDSDTVYPQAPFESITQEKYLEMCNELRMIDLTQVMEEVDTTDHEAEAACAGDSCTVFRV